MDARQSTASYIIFSEKAIQFLDVGILIDTANPFIFKEVTLILDGWFRGLDPDRIMTNPYGSFSFDGYLGFRS